MRIHPIPPINQSVLRKVGFELSYERRKGGVISLFLYFSNNSIIGGDRESSGKI